MGTQFWWFYDVVVIATVLVCIFLSGRKGLMKSVFTAIGCAVAFFIAFAVSGGISSSMYKSTVRNSNVKKIEKSINENTFESGYAKYLEGMGYFIKVNTEKLENIFKSDDDLDSALCLYVNNINSKKVEENEAILLEKIREGYAVVVRDIVEKDLGKFAAEMAAKEVREDNSGIHELASLMSDSNTLRKSAEFIADNYVASAYTTLFRVGGFAVLYVLLAIVVIAVINAFSSSNNFESTGSHISGGFVGIVTGGLMVFAVSAIIRLWAIMGNNEMLFFNSDVIEKTFVFKYFYDLVLNM